MWGPTAKSLSRHESCPGISPAREGGALPLPALLGRVFLLRAGQLLGMDDGLVDRAAGRPETGELGIDAVALQHIDGRERFAADLVGGGALDDRPMNTALAGLLLDIV